MVDVAEQRLAWPHDLARRNLLVPLLLTLQAPQAHQALMAEEVNDNRIMIMEWSVRQRSRNYSLISATAAANSASSWIAWWNY